MSSNIDKTLAERGTRYGEFTEHALYTQDMKRAMQRIPANWHKLSDDKKQALEMVVHKIGRILNGDPEYIDSWHDIIGYVRLVEKNLEEAQRAPPPVDNEHVAPGCERFADPIGRVFKLYSEPVELQIPVPPSPEGQFFGFNKPMKGPASPEQLIKAYSESVPYHYCAGENRNAPGYAIECDKCKTAIYGPRTI